MNRESRAIKTYVWGSLPSQNAETAFVDFVKAALAKYKEGWKAFQQAIGRPAEKFGLCVSYDVALAELGVPGSKAQIDLVINEEALVHVSGRQAPRHEKELLEIAAVASCSDQYRYGVLIVRVDNELRLEGETLLLRLLQ